MLADIIPFNNYVCITRINTQIIVVVWGFFEIDSTTKVKRTHETVKIQKQKELKKKKISIWPLHTNFLFLYIAQHRSSI